MKKNLLAVLTLSACLTTVTSKAAPIWSDTIPNCPLGGIHTNSGGLLIPYLPGSVTAHDVLVNSNNFGAGAAAASSRRMSVFQGGAEYIHRWFDPVATNGYASGNGSVLYASLILNVNLLPTQGGTYFAHFMDAGAPLGTNAFEFRGRIFVVSTTNSYPFTNTVPGTYRLG